MISEKLLNEVLQAALSTGGDFAEIFVEDTKQTNFRMLDGLIEDAVSGRDFGLGIRIFQGHRAV